MKKRYLIIAFIILSLISLFLGVHSISIADIISGNTEKINVFLISRVPRLISIIVAGVGLSISGVIMQQISNNKFVSPTTAATIDSAKLGVLVSMLLFSSATLTQKMITAFIFSLLGTFVFMRIMKKIKFKNVIFVPLLGIMLGNVVGAITDFFAYKFDLMQNMSSFMQGNFAVILKGNYEILYLTIPLLIVAFLYSNKFTIIGMGEDISTNLGLNFERVANIGMIIVSLITALVVIIVGSIPFVGLIVPNIVSIFMGDNLGKNIWVTSLFGAIFLLTCDIIGRILIYPYEIPISLTVGVIGSVVFLYMIFRRTKNEG
ncbi:ABC transporter permease [Clostridium mediterraneense]|uniref:ABC transporter permease n=1 Tax=Clostridium mediterraneense TaxID=1805472 RepID=UPI0008317EDB|nr:ABC transporter permease [Clostridium mediterraneense]